MADRKNDQALTERVYVDAENNVVKADDPRAARIFSKQDADRLGLTGPGKSYAAHELDREVELLNAAQERGALNEVAVRKEVLRRDHGADGAKAVASFEKSLSKEEAAGSAAASSVDDGAKAIDSAPADKAVRSAGRK